MAKHFEFRLAQVLRLRKLAVDQQRRALAEAMRASAEANRRIAALGAQWQDEVQEGRRVRTGVPVDMQALRDHQLHRARLQRDMNAAGDELNARAALQEAERGRLADATKRLRVIEKLRERQWLRFCREQDRAEQAVFDEAAVQQYARSSVGASEINA